MRTLLIIAGGLVLLAVFLGLAGLLPGRGRQRHFASFVLFTVVWVAFAGANMWVGITQAGYGFMEELPIFLVIVLVPVVPGYFIQKRLQRRDERDSRPDAES